MSMARVSGPECVAYYTDGSVDPASGRTGADALTGSTELCAKTSDHCCTLQTELVAIQLALEHSQHRHQATVVLHTDSRAMLQVLLLTPASAQVKARARRAASQHAHQLHWQLQGKR